MSSNDRMSDSTVARIAGNLMSSASRYWDQQTIEQAVATARAIVAEVRRTTPPAPPQEFPTPRLTNLGASR